MRSDFLVTSSRKKLWNTQIGLIKEVERICKKHNIKWFADSGTLLGAVRHGGFIPWDDDVDLIMFRPDFNKFIEIAPYEIKPPYFLDIWYNYNIEDEKNSVPESDLPLITFENKLKHGGAFPLIPMLKLRDSRTTMIEFYDRPNVNQGIWIDIFVLDSVPSLADNERMINFNAGLELLIATLYPEKIRELMQNKTPLTITYESLEEFLKLPYKQRALNFENHMTQNYFESEKVNIIYLNCVERNPRNRFFKDYEEIIYLPFEKIELPCPKGYENILKILYGDWRTPIKSHYHVLEYSADISYKEFFSTT